MAKKPIYRTIIRYEILSEERIPNMSLTRIYEETYDGHMSGRFLSDEVTNEILRGVKAVKAIKFQGTSPEFFELDDKGNTIKE